jgi:hypothetical protein
MILLLLLALGCPTPDTGVPPDGDTDTDADTDPAAWDGAWTGDVTVEVYERSLALSGTCRGEASFTVDHEADPAVTGAAACDFGGDPIVHYVPPLSFVFAGDFTSGSEVAGDVVTTAGHATATGSWIGTFAEDTFSASWEGTVVYYHYTIDYAGSVDAVR